MTALMTIAIGELVYIAVMVGLIYQRLGGKV